MITGTALIAYASDPPHAYSKGLHINFMNVFLLQSTPDFIMHMETYPETGILFLLSILNIDVESSARQKWSYISEQEAHLYLI